MYNETKQKIAQRKVDLERSLGSKVTSEMQGHNGDVFNAIEGVKDIIWMPAQYVK
jgi:hypothetical protein